MPNFYINMYSPLIATSAGQLASDKQKLPPFIDGSVRRDPDLEHEYPSISVLSRTGNLTPQLGVGDIVAYMTRKGRHFSDVAHWRLTAVLLVEHVFDSHQSAAEWYTNARMRLPGNCMISRNPPMPYQHCDHDFDSTGWEDPNRIHQEREEFFRGRAETHGTFVVCMPLFRDLSMRAPVVIGSDFVDVFGERLRTRNPVRISTSHFFQLMKRIGIELSHAKHSPNTRM